MPSKTTVERAKEDLRKGKTAAGEFVREEMEHIREGKHGARSPKQAIAIGLSKARRAGVPLEPPGKGQTKERTRRSAEAVYEVGQGERRPRSPSRRRSAAQRGGDGRAEAGAEELRLEARALRPGEAGRRAAKARPALTPRPSFPSRALLRRDRDGHTVSAAARPRAPDALLTHLIGAKTTGTGRAIGLHSRARSAGARTPETQTMHVRSFLVTFAATLALVATPALAQHGSQHGNPAAGIAEGTVQKGVRTVEMSVTENGFEPSKVKAKKGEKLRLVVTRKTDKTCATEILIPEHGINKPLPLDEAVTVELTPKKSGEIRYACGMGHITGIVFVP